MNKVTSVNLNNKAYQLEEQAYKDLQNYLERAKSALTHDPDQAEVMADLEQSIADKCDRYVSDAKDVVTAAEITKILEAMGPVEAAETGTEQPEKGNNPPKPRKFYLVKEGAMLAGVCNGIGAYLGVPANVIRLLFILLTVFTSGIWILIYIVLALAVPTADDDEKLAEAYGTPITAQQVIERAKSRATNPETLSHAGLIIMRIWRVIAKLVTIVGIAAAAALSIAWIVGQWAIGLGRVHFQGSLSDLNGWRQWVFITAAYLLLVIPVLLVVRLFNRVADSRTSTKRTTITDSGLAVLWGIALATFIGLASVYAVQVRDYVDAHKGYLDIGGSHICVDASKCDPGFNHHHRYDYTAKPVPPVAPLAPVGH